MMLKKIQNYINSISTFLLTLLYIITLGLVLLFLTRLYLIQLIDLYALELINPHLHKFLYGSSYVILEEIKNLHIDNILYNPATVIIGNITDCSDLAYLVEFQQFKDYIAHFPGSGINTIAYDVDLNKHFLRICCNRQIASLLVSDCPEIVKTRVENALVNNCYCCEIRKELALAHETLKLLGYE